jgi:TRAP-type uncharacterized transport system substrate-binding protein
MFKCINRTILVLALTALVLPMQAVFVSSDAEARRGGSSRSFSRSSYRSKATQARKPVFKSIPRKTKAQRPVAKKIVATKKTFAPKKTFAATPRAGKHQAAKTRARFKKQPAINNTSRAKTSSYRARPSYTRAASYDRGTYYNRRSSHYGTWNTPAYAYYGSPSYGMFDTLFLYHALSSPHGWQMGYHYRSDPGYKTWRADAEKLGVENAELRTQLAAMDAKVSTHKGPVDPNFVPNGVDADLMLSDEVRQTLIPVFNACVAGASGTYAKLIVNTIKPNTSNVTINIIPTSGSGEIIANIAANKCDGGFVQSDSYWNYIEDNETMDLPFERVVSPYKESVHLVCNTQAASIYGLSSLDKDNTVYYPANSGAAETWKNLVNENDDYGDINAVAVTSYESAMIKAAQQPNACALYVGATGSSELMRKTNGGATQNKLELVEVVDPDILDTTDPAGAKVYSAGVIDDATYPALLREGGCYSWCSGDVPTLQVNADFIISAAWKTKNESSYTGFVLDLMGMQSAIAKGANR